MIETALVFDKDGGVIHWHEPPGRSGGSIPDSRDLWDILWENRRRLGGVAHTHPWNGPTSPSGTDTTTFAAVEAGLGRYLLWPIVTVTHVNYFVKNVITGDYIETSGVTFQDIFRWIKNIRQLREKSKHPLGVLEVTQGG